MLVNVLDPGFSVPRSGICSQSDLWDSSGCHGVPAWPVDLVLPHQQTSASEEVGWVEGLSHDTPEHPVGH